MLVFVSVDVVILVLATSFPSARLYPVPAPDVEFPNGTSVSGSPSVVVHVEGSTNTHYIVLGSRKGSILFGSTALVATIRYICFGICMYS